MCGTCDLRGICEPFDDCEDCACYINEWEDEEEGLSPLPHALANLTY